jgi:hypothetical protein
MHFFIYSLKTGKRAHITETDMEESIHTQLLRDGKKQAYAKAGHLACLLCEEYNCN